MQGDDRNDQFDDLFEPFELGDTPAAGEPSAPTAQDITETFDPHPCHPPRSKPVSSRFITTT